MLATRAAEAETETILVITRPFSLLLYGRTLLLSASETVSGLCLQPNFLDERGILTVRSVDNLTYDMFVEVEIRIIHRNIP